jgi:uncharacterized damage-inducible protein DinB
MKYIYCLLLSFCFFSGKGQNAFKDSLKNQLIADWIRAKAYTQEYLQAMPADKYGFRPTDSMRSYAQQMLHLATANAGLGSIGTGTKFPFASLEIEKWPSAQTKDSVMYYVNTSYDFVIESIRNMDVGKLSEVVAFNLPGGKRTETRLVWLMKTFEHQTHHRAQCTVYLRLAGVHPPPEKLF